MLLIPAVCVVFDCRRGATATMATTMALRTALSLPLPAPASSPRAAAFPAPLSGGRESVVGATHAFHQPLLSTSELAVTVTPFLKYFISPGTYNTHGRAVPPPSSQCLAATGSMRWHPAVKACAQALLTGGDGVFKVYPATGEEAGGAGGNKGLQTSVSNVIEVDEDIDGFSD
jgi:hypothetical protein